MLIDIFCQVIDNYGDIAIVYRMARTLKDARPEWRLRLYVDDLVTFEHLCPQVDPSQNHQDLDFGEVYLWKGIEDQNFWKESPPDVIIPFLGCELPEAYVTWIGNSAPSSQALRDRIILLVEYLTAESWSEEIHGLPSLIPYPHLKKFFFVPGFREKSGGILLDKAYLKLKSSADLDLTAFRNSFMEIIHCELSHISDSFWLSIFSYEHNFNGLLEDLESLKRPSLAFLPQGRPSEGFLKTLKARGYTRNSKGLWTKDLVSVQELPFMAQEVYDRLVLACDFNIVRGEESWMRAVLSGRPFLWQAYLQDEGYQLVKVEAFLEVLRPWLERHCETKDVQEVERTFSAMNKRLRNDPDKSLGESYRVFIEKSPQLRMGFGDFASYLEKNADLTGKMLDFIESFQI